jgi:uncharacterized protein
MEFTWTSCLSAAAAALLVGLSKTGVPGAAIPSVAMMALAFGGQTKLSVWAMVPILLVGDLMAVVRYRGFARWDQLFRLFPFVVCGMIPAYFFFGAIRDEQLRPLLGILVLVLIALELGRRWAAWDHLPGKLWFVGLIGVLAGFCTVIGNAAGPVMNLYLLSMGLSKQNFMGTAAWFFFLVNLSKVPFFFFQGMITPNTLWLDLAVVPAVLVGAMLGFWLLRRLPEKVFAALVLILAAGAGVQLLF